MCWAIPAKIISIKDRMATVEVSGVRKNAALDLISNVTVGDFVLVHAGYAIEKVNEADANFTINFFNGGKDNA